jgi:UDP-galactopyranose mutase
MCTFIILLLIYSIVIYYILLGGGIAFTMAAQEPELITQVVLIDAQGFIDGNTYSVHTYSITKPTLHIYLILHTYMHTFFAYIRIELNHLQFILLI